MALGPLDRTRQDRTTGARRRLGEMGPTLAGVDPSVRNAYTDFLRRKAEAGGQIPGETESLAAIRAAETGEAQTPEPESSVWDVPGNVFRNIQETTAVVPQLFMPNRGNPLYQEIHKTLTETPQGVSEAFQSGNPFQAFGTVAAQPGIRFAPGAYVAENVLGGEVPETGERGSIGELARNPVWTALDVLPYAQAGAKSTKAFRAASAQHADELPRVLEQAGDAQVRSLSMRGLDPGVVDTRPPAPFRTALTRTVTPEGEVVRNRLGQATERAATRARETGAGQKLAQMFGAGQEGRQARMLAGLQNRLNVDVDRLWRGDPEATTNLRDTAMETARRQGPERAHRSAYEADPEGYVRSQAEASTQWRLADLVDERRAMRERHAEILSREPDDLARINERMETGRLDDLTDTERAFAEDYRGLQDRFKTFVADEFPERVQKFRHDSPEAQILDDELLDLPDYRRVRAQERKLGRARRRKSVAENNLTGPGGAVGRILGDEVATHRPRGQAQMVRTSPAPLRRLYDEFDARAGELGDSKVHQATRHDIGRYRKAVDRFARSENPRVMEESLVEMRDTLRDVSRRKSVTRNWGIEDTIDEARVHVGESLSDVRSARKAGSPRKLEGDVERAAKRLDEAVGRAAPARFRPMIDEQYQRAMREELEAMRGRGYDVTADLAAVDARQYQALRSMSQETADMIWRDVERGWRELKAAGHDPIFVHGTSPDDAARIDYPRVAPRPSDPGQVRARTRDVTPTVGNPWVALDHQAMELVQTLGTREVVDSVGEAFGRTYGQMLDEQTRLATARGSSNPIGDATDWVEKNTVVWPPEGVGYRRRASRLPGREGEVRVPKVLADVMEQTHTPPGGRLTAAMDPVMKVFRTALLPLSPRWHVYNFTGGSIILSVENPKAWRQLGRAARDVGGPWEAMTRAWRGDNAPRVSTTPRGAPPTRGGVSGVTIPDKMLREPPTSTNRLVATRRWAGGGKMRDLWDQAQAWKASQPAGKGPFGRVVDASYAANQWWDDMIRTMTSYEAIDQARAAGKGVAEAEHAAIQASRKVMMEWDNLLPLERQILRGVFPFYSWGRFVVGYTMRYPFDHSLRASVLGSLSRAEMRDRGTGLPDTFAHMFQLNSVDDDGNAQFLATRGLNPFRDTTDWFTLEGFVGNSNPIISGTLQALGVERGGPMLYPDLVYDPETGGVKPQTPGIVESLVTSTIPQAELVQNQILGSHEWDELVQRNPEAAGRQLLAQIGVPASYQTRNVPQEQMRAEINRFSSMRDAWNRAVAEGTTDQFAADYPELSGYVDQFQSLNRQSAEAQEIETPSAWQAVAESVR